MSRIDDRTYLLNDQYRDRSHLDARIGLHRRFSTNPYGVHRWFFDYVRLPAGSCVLEVGCGPGRLWQVGMAAPPAGWAVTLTFVICTPFVAGDKHGWRKMGWMALPAVQTM